VTFNHGVEGSSPSALTKFKIKINAVYLPSQLELLVSHMVHTLCTPRTRIFPET
jgi:hypothetical protein